MQTSIQTCAQQQRHAWGQVYSCVCPRPWASPQEPRRIGVCHDATRINAYKSNLGVLQPVVEVSPGPADDPYAMQRVTADSLSSRGYYLDGTAIFGSLVLLVVLLALTFERILGLDRYVNLAVQRWRESRQYQRRNDVIKAREALEDSWDSDEPK